MDAADERRIHQAFLVSLAIKAADAILEIAAAVALAVLDAAALQNTVLRLASKHLLHHPDDRVFAWVVRAAESFSIEVKTFAVLYLASHGIIKLILVVGLWRNQAWAYPVSLIAFSGFIAYQIYRFTFTHSPFLVVLTVFDIVVIALVWHEWRFRRARGDFARRLSK